MALDLSQYIAEIATSTDWGQIAPRLKPLFEKIRDGINQAASAAGVDATSHLQQPNPPAKLDIKVAGELAHVAITDNSDRTRSRHYFVEYSNNTSFSNAYVEHMGVSRNKVLNLPTNDDNGSPHNWYFRTYSMEPGSTKASPKVYHGQALAPTPVVMGGTTNLSLLPSTGAGTAPSNGQRAGQGYGTVQRTSGSK